MYLEFLEFENDNKCYEKYALWQLLRKKIYYDIAKNKIDSSRSHGFFGIVRYLFETLISAFFMLPFPVSHDTLYIGHPRWISKKWNDEGLITMRACGLPFTYLDQSRQTNIQNIFNRRGPFLVLKIISKIGVFCAYRSTKNDVQEISNLIHENFSVKLNEHLYISEILYHKYCFRYFGLIFSLSKIKRIFYVRSDNYLALLYAARKYSIDTFEFQHGDIVKEELSISHPKSVKEHVLAPTYLLVYSILWLKGVNTFSVPIEVGKPEKHLNDMSAPQIIFVMEIFNHKQQLIFFERLACLVESFLPNVNVILKMHPSTSQSAFFDKYKRRFSESPNVVVVYDQFRFEQLLNVESIVIGKYSTALFFAMDVGLRTFVVESSIRNFINTNPKNTMLFGDYEKLLTYFENVDWLDKDFFARQDIEPSWFKNHRLDELKGLLS